MINRQTSVPTSLSLSPSLFPSHFLSLSLFLSFSPFLSTSHSLFLSISCTSLSLSLSLSLPHLYHTTPLSFPLSFSISLTTQTLEPHNVVLACDIQLVTLAHFFSLTITPLYVMIARYPWDTSQIHYQRAIVPNVLLRLSDRLNAVYSP